jgi:hypothetical protein
MATIKEQYEVSVSSHLACAIEYGDFNGEYTEQDIEQVETFWAKYPNAVFSWGEESSFSRCDVCHLMADCVDCTITIFE